MLESGLAKSVLTMNQLVLEQEFRNFYGNALDVLPMVIGEGEFVNGWLATMVRKHRKANHPLYHLLHRIFLRSVRSINLYLEKGHGRALILWPAIRAVIRSKQFSSIVITVRRLGYFLVNVAMFIHDGLIMKPVNWGRHDFIAMGQRLNQFYEIWFVLVVRCVMLPAFCNWILRPSYV